MTQKKSKSAKKVTTPKSERASRKFVFLITLAAIASIILPVIIYLLIFLGIALLDNPDSY